MDMESSVSGGRSQIDDIVEAGCGEAGLMAGSDAGLVAGCDVQLWKLVDR